MGKDPVTLNLASPNGKIIKIHLPAALTPTALAFKLC